MNIDELNNKQWKFGDWTYINKLQWNKPEIDQVISVLESDWFGGASIFNTKFEDTVKRFIGSKSFQSTNSGSAALEVAIQIMLQTKQWKSGDKILHPALTFPTSISSAIMAGLIPVYVDVDPGTYVISIEAVEKALQEHPDIVGAIIPLLIGNVPDIDNLLELLGNRQLILDSCDTIGSQWKEKEAATYGDMFAYSFYGSHHISTFGVGGGLGTNDEHYADLAKSLTFWGRDFEVEKGDRLTSFLKRYSYKTIGFDAQMSAVQAAFGLAQMDRLPSYLGQRNTIFRKLQQLFARHEKYIILPTRVSDKADPNWFCFPITLKQGSPFTREEIVNYLLDHKIEIRPIMTLLPDQPPYQRAEHIISGQIPNTLGVQNRGFFLPSCPMEKDQLDYYLSTIKEFLDRY